MTQIAGIGESAVGEVTIGTDLLPPDTPTLLDDTISHELTLDWNEVSGVDGYRLYRAESSGTSTGDYTQVADVDAPPHTDSELKSGEKYFYRLSVYKSAESSLSGEVSGITPLPAPTNISVSNIMPYTADIAWNSRDQNGDQRIYTEANGTKTDASGSLATATESFTLDSLQSDTQYTVSVQAETEHNTSEDVALTFTVGPEETLQKDSVYAIKSTKTVAGVLEVLDYE